YPPLICEFTLITNEQIGRVIAKLSLHKAPGLNGIGNCIFTHCAAQLVPFMGLIFCMTFTLEIYLNQWKKSSTIVL
ncbi:hypothetical protein BDR04DRAFT_959426, partial [Suillus decipiens]